MANGAGSHAERLDVLGLHIAQVVHELSAPLSLIAGSLQELRRCTEASSQFIAAVADTDERAVDLRRQLDLDARMEHTRELLKLCRQGVHRLDHLVRQLRFFGSAQANLFTPAAVDVGALVGTAIALVSADRDTAPIRRYINELPPVLGSIDLLGQALVNLIANALDAVASISHPWVDIHATHELDPAPHVQITIRDNGPGIPAEIRSRIFEPFFTTKSKRLGMGLGLSICQQIVAAHGGTLSLLQSSAAGTAFAIDLPCAPGLPAASVPPMLAGIAGATGTAGLER
jgi:signal transduction histidine kinase